jgi:hypothetical protein
MIALVWKKWFLFKHNKYKIIKSVVNEFKNRDPMICLGFKKKISKNIYKKFKVHLFTTFVELIFGKFKA